MSDRATAKFVGAQLLAWAECFQRRDQSVAAHLDEIFAAARAAGYDYVEGFLDLDFPQNNVRFAAAMRRAGLRPVSLSADVRLHDAEAPAAIDKLLAAAKICRESGYLAINLHPETIDRDKTDDELRAQADALDRIGRELNRLELVLGVHTQQIETQHGAREMRSNLRRTDPAHVGLCFDPQWLYRGGRSPLATLREYHDRIVSWRIRQSVSNEWRQTLVDGDVDYASLARFQAEHQFRGSYTVELAYAAKGAADGKPRAKSEDNRAATDGADQDLATLTENHRQSREYFRKVFGV